MRQSNRVLLGFSLAFSLLTMAYADDCEVCRSWKAPMPLIAEGGGVLDCKVICNRDGSSIINYDSEGEIKFTQDLTTPRCPFPVVYQYFTSENSAILKMTRILGNDTVPLGTIMYAGKTDCKGWMETVAKSNPAAHKRLEWWWTDDVVVQTKVIYSPAGSMHAYDNMGNVYIIAGESFILPPTQMVCKVEGGYWLLQANLAEYVNCGPAIGVETGAGQSWTDGSEGGQGAAGAEEGCEPVDNLTAATAPPAQGGGDVLPYIIVVVVAAVVILFFYLKVFKRGESKTEDTGGRVEELREAVKEEQVEKLRETL